MRQKKTKQSFHDQVAAMHKKVLAIAKKYTNNQVIAEDLAQDAILKALQNEDKFDGSNLHAWLYTIVKNTYITQYNRSQKSGEYAMIDDYMIDRGLSTHISVNEGDCNIQVDQINQAINLLPKELKCIISDRIKGLKYQEIAKKYKMPIGTIKNKIHLARKALKSIDSNNILLKRKSKSTIN